MASPVQVNQSPNSTQSPLFLFLIGVCLPLQIFVLLAVVITRNSTGLPWDVPLLLAIHRTAKPSLDLFAELLTQLGYVQGVTPVVVLVSLILLFRQQWHRCVYLLITAFGSILISYSAKLFFHRARPHLWELLYPLPSDYSFPSGHSFLSMMLLVALIHLTWGNRWCKWVMIVGGIFVVGIGWTRMYLGVHYPSDVLGGWMLAIAWGIMVNLSLKFPSSSLIVKEQESS